MPSTTEKKKRKSRTTTVRNESKHCEQCLPYDDDLDEYMYKRETTEDEKEVIVNEYRHNMQEFEALPTLVHIPDMSRLTLNTLKVLKPPTISIHETNDLHIVTIGKHTEKDWRPHFIGKNGRTIQNLQKESMCNISLSDFHSGTRLIVRGCRHNRELCCILARDRIMQQYQ